VLVISNGFRLFDVVLFGPSSARSQDRGNAYLANRRAADGRRRPLYQLDRQREVFDDDLEKQKILPIYLLTKNSGERPLSLRRSDITLELPNGSRIIPIQTETVLQWLGWSSGGGGGGPVYGREVIAAIALLPLTLPFAVANSRGSEARKARIADYMEKGFKDVKLNRGDSMHGFVYFWSHFKEDWPLKGNLILRFVNEIDGSDFIVRVPVIEQ
jgi:hypothetical protein